MVAKILRASNAPLCFNEIVEGFGSKPPAATITISLSRGHDLGIFWVNTEKHQGRTRTFYGITKAGLDFLSGSQKSRQQK
jgi:hypothetical protein